MFLLTKLSPLNRELEFLSYDIFKLGLACLKELKKKHTDSGYQGSFWENISTLISNQQVQFSEFLSNDDPASNDSSKQHQVSTGSSAALTVNHPGDSSGQHQVSTGSSAALTVNHPGDSSGQHQVSTGSSEVLTVNQNLLVSLSRKNGF